MTTVFHRVGSYEIHEEIGRGGMAVVFLATDTRTNQQVALKLVSIESDRDGQQVLEAEQWGAKLQEEFCRESGYVPGVFEHGTHGPYFFIAMEHLGGRNLSEIIGEGPMPVSRAVRVATQLCEFLQAADAFERTLDGRQFNLLLHGDLKPRNIRVLEGDEIKIFDFGIAKALSLSRKVTRNDFGSIAYLSPERLESGEIDAQAELWAVGVLLYEMISGVQPFRAADTRRLEQPHPRPHASGDARRWMSRSAAGDRRQAARGERGRSLPERCRDPRRPPTLHSGRLSAGAGGALVRAAGRRGGDATHAPRPSSRTRPDVTRRTVREPRQVSAAVSVVPTAEPVPATVNPPVTAGKPRRRIRTFIRRALTVIAIIMVLNEIRVYLVAGALAANVPSELGDVVQLWNQYADLTEPSLNMGVQSLRRALTRQSMQLADRTFTRYRTVGTTVYEREWRLTRDALGFAARANGSDSRIQAALRYSDGHLSRIDGEARVRGNQSVEARDALTAAVTAFRQSAEARQSWPDPFLGLMRTFIALEDIEQGADALAQAERYGYVAGSRDWAMLGEGYLARARKLGESEELEPLNRAADAYTQAVDYFTKAIGFGNVSRRLRDAQRGLRDVQERLERLPFQSTVR